jgi:hypothetical protein
MELQTNEVLNNPKLLRTLQDRAKLSRTFITNARDKENIDILLADI